MTLLNLLLTLVLMAAAACGRKSEDSNTSSDPVAGAIIPGGYSFTGATLTPDAGGGGDYTVSDNSLNYLISYDAGTGYYSLAIIGEAVLTYPGGATYAGCHSGASSSKFKVDSGNEVLAGSVTNIDDNCIDSSEAKNTSGIINIGEKIYNSTGTMLVREVRAVINGEGALYDFYFVKK